MVSNCKTHLIQHNHANENVIVKSEVTGNLYFYKGLAPVNCEKFRIYITFETDFLTCGDYYIDNGELLKVEEYHILSNASLHRVVARMNSCLFTHFIPDTFVWFFVNSYNKGIIVNEVLTDGFKIMNSGGTEINIKYEK